jgi:ABC-2 type transport system permease protein
MNPRRSFAILLRQLYLLRGSPARIVPMFAWVAIDVLLWGFITRYLNQVSATGFNFVPAMLGAVLLWDFLVRVMQGVTTAFFEDVWSRNFLNVFATPITIADYVGGLVASSITTSSISLVVMLILATGVFGLSVLSYGLALVPFLLILFLFAVALGILGCALVLRLGPAAEWLIWPIPALISPLACVFYPVSALPGWMQTAAHCLPPVYVFESMRAIVAGKPVSMNDLLAGFGLAVLTVLLAGAFLNRVYHHAVRTGLLARYAAEAVG